MKINELTTRSDIEQSSKVEKAYFQFEKLLSIIRQRNIPLPVIERINEIIADLNQTPTKDLKNKLRKKQFQLINILEQELKIVPINHYRNKWLGIGMAAIGIPIGISLGMSLGNMAYFAIGLPIGMAIGIGVGTKWDKEAQSEGRQLEIELKH